MRTDRPQFSPVVATPRTECKGSAESDVRVTQTSAPWRRAAVWVACLAMAATSLVTEVALAANPNIEIRGEATPTTARKGEAVVVSFDTTVPDGYHMYCMTEVPEGPLKLQAKLDGNALEALGPWHAPKPNVERDPNFDKDVEYYTGTVRHSRPFQLLAAPNEGGAVFTVRGQLCNERHCISFKEHVTVALALDNGEARPDRIEAPALEGVAFTADRSPPGGSSSGGNRLPTEGGLLGYLLFAFLAGLAALLTPCVFPMIPITVSFFTKYSEVSLGRSITMASVYTGSIIGTFTLLGILVSVIFGAVGMQAISTSIAFNLFLFALLIVFSLNLFGLFEIRVPSALVNKSSEQERNLMDATEAPLSRQLLGVFFMALTFTLVSFTCTVAFIGLVLAEAAKGNVLYPTLGMLAFSTGFSLPFFLLAMFPSYAHRLRGKAGDWMVVVKVVLGFLELAAAFKFLSNVDLIWQWGFVTRSFVLACWAAIFFTAGLYLLRIFSLPHNDEGARKVNPLSMCLAILMFAMAFHSASGLRDAKSMGGWIDAWLPPAVYPGEEAPHATGDDGHLSWIQNDMPQGMAEAKKANQPLFMDFTGYNCSNCRYMESSVFTRSDVRSRLEKMVRVAAYTDGGEEVHDRQREYQLRRFDTVALPFYAFIDPHDEKILASFADMTKDPKEYVAFLDRGLAAYAARGHGVAKPAPAAAAKESAEQPPKDAKPVTLDPNGPMVDLTLPKLSGEGEVSLASLRGKWVLLNFWAKWCGPCKKELKNEFPPALKDRDDVVLVTIAFDEEDARKANQAFITEAKLTHHVNLFAGAEVDEAKLPKALGEQTGELPVTYLIDPQGRLAWQKNGALHTADLNRLLDARK